MLLFLLAFGLDHGQLEKLGADLQSGGCSHLRIDAKTHSLPFHQERNNGSALGERINIAHRENAPGVNGLDNLAGARGFRRANKQNMTGSGGDGVTDMANDERASIYGLALDDALDGPAEWILTQHA